MGYDEHGPAYPEPDNSNPVPPKYVGLPTAQALVLWAVVIACLLWLFMTPAPAMDHGFDPNSATTKWFEQLKVPPEGIAACCGKADAYPVSEYWKNPDGTWTARIKDGRAIKYPDGTVRAYIATGTEVIVPAESVNDLTDDLDNPTDTSWIFMRVSEAQVSKVFCLVRHPEGN